MMDKAEDTTKQPIQNPEENFVDPVLGVLMVHGIGDQKRGETVPWGGDPLYNWLRRWFGISNEPDQDRNIYLADTRLTRPIPSEQDAPPYAHLRFKGLAPEDIPDHQWLIAESYWAQEFTPPSYAETVPFGLVVAPLVLERIAGQTINRLLAVIRRPGSLGDLLWWVLRVPVWLFSHTFIFIVGSLVQLLLVAISLLGVIPVFSTVVPKLQLHLAGWLGDAYLMAVSPTRLSAMVSQIRRDIAWLASKERGRGCCKAVAVVAHSGGAVIAHKALLGPDAPDFGAPILLITYGSGQRKVHIMEQFNINSPAFARVTPLFRIVSAACIFVTLLLLVQEHPSWWGITLFGIMGIFLQGLLLVVATLWKKSAAQEAPYRPTMPKGGEWVDYAAVADIVNDKPICAVQADQSNVTVTDRINNLHSPLKDHGGYWRNQEEFLANVARLLYKKALNKDLAPPADKPRFFAQAKQYRERRVLALLTAMLLLVGSLPGIWLGLQPWLGDTLGSFLRNFIVNIIPGQAIPAVPPSDGSNLVPTGDLIWFWSHVFGLLALIAIMALLAQQGMVAIWRAWSSAEEKAFFERRYCTDDKSSKRLKRWFAFSAAIAPLFATLLLSDRWWYGRIPIVETLPWLSPMPPLPSLPGLLSWLIGVPTIAILLVAIANAVSILRDTPPGQALQDIDEPPCSDTPNKSRGPAGLDVTQRVLKRISSNLEEVSRTQAITNERSTIS